MSNRCIGSGSGVGVEDRLAERARDRTSFVLVTLNIPEVPESSSMIRKTAVGWKSTISADGVREARFTVLIAADGHGAPGW